MTVLKHKIITKFEFLFYYVNVYVMETLRLPYSDMYLIMIKLFYQIFTILRNVYYILEQLIWKQS